MKASELLAAIGQFPPDSDVSIDDLFAKHVARVSTTGELAAFVPWSKEKEMMDSWAAPGKPVVPLTAQEIEQIAAWWDFELHGDRTTYIVRMTEKAHGISAH